MSRFGDDPHAFFQSVYQQAAPWDIGAIQPAMAELIDRFPPVGPVLDLGCGTGDLAIHLALRGCRVLAVDFVESAIGAAEGKRATLPSDVAERIAFQVADATMPSVLGTFGSVFDSGFMHLLDDAQTATLVAELSRTLWPGGRLYLHEFAHDFGIPNVPRAVAEAEVRTRFTRDTGWMVLDIVPTEFVNTVGPPVPAIAACIERVV